MNYSGIVNRLLILVCCILNTILIGNREVQVTAVLLTILINCASCYYQWIVPKLLMMYVFAIWLLFFPDNLLFLPVLLYEYTELCLEMRGKKDFFFAILLEGLILVVQISMLFDRFKLGEIWGTAVIALGGLWIQWLVQQCNLWKKRYIVSRDDSVELTSALRKKNRYLREKQDSDIYAATLQERNRIAREIHDNVGHVLSRAILMVGALITINQNQAMEDELQGLKRSLDEGMNSIRRSVHDLHDESVDLKQTIQDIIQDIPDREIFLNFDLEKPTSEVKYCVIAVVKEAVANNLKHSNGSRIDISIQEHPGFYQIRVSDNGCCDEKVNYNSGIGLQNISDRVESLNGVLEIKASSQGFLVFVSIPKSGRNKEYRI